MLSIYFEIDILDQHPIRLTDRDTQQRPLLFHLFLYSNLALGNNRLMKLSHSTWLLLLILACTFHTSAQPLSFSMAGTSQEIRPSEVAPVPDPVDSLLANARYWANIGLGAGTTGVSAVASVSYRFNGNLLSLRGSTTGGAASDDYWDVGLLYGRTASGSWYQTSLSAGIGLMGGRTNQDGPVSARSTETLEPTVSLPLEAQLFWRPADFWGLGLSAFANINAKQSFGGIALCLQVGNLR